MKWIVEKKKKNKKKIWYMYEYLKLVWFVIVFFFDVIGFLLNYDYEIIKY